MPNRANEDRVKAILGDLGRATLRGVRKCPKCGTFNGTRGISCKNRACDVVFKETGEKRKLSTDACKLITGASSQLFSVRVRDRGPDFRGFVYVPVTQNMESEAIIDPTIITQTSCQCFVDTCLRSYVEKGESLSLVPCTHIQAALRCFSDAEPLTIKQNVLTSLNINSEMKQAIWLLASETEGPLVQRISKNMMVVKCKPTPKFPLGYLHLSLFATKVKDKLEHRFSCSCKSYKTGKTPMKEDCYARKCLHYYACICAFASDEKLTQEYSFYVTLESQCETQMSTQLVAVLTKQTESGTSELEVEVIGDETSFLEATGLTLTEDGQLAHVSGLGGLSEAVNVQIQTVTTSGDTFSFSALDPASLLSDNSTQLKILSLKRKKDDPVSHSSLLALQDTTPAPARKPRKVPTHTTNKRSMETPDETRASISFEEWLSSVTERINETMHFQFAGKPEALVFHVPHVFFDCLRERISNGGKKKRLPNFTTGFVRKHALPLGTFTKYSWHITNIIQVKRIFDTSLVELQITRSFVENKDGTYEHFHHRDDERERFRKTENAPLIKPLELRTFLKVGNTSPDQKEPTPFLIEWVPDILPLSHVGELRIEFQYGHQRSGGPILSEKVNCVKPILSHIKIL